MIHRVTENIKYNMLTNNMLNIQREYSDLMEKLSTQKMINRPSDDPVGTNDILDARSAINAIEQYKTNITDADISLSMTETALSSVKKIVADALSIAISEASTGAPETMAISAQTVSSLIGEALSLMNTKNGDGFLFAGSNTDTQPYTYDSATGVSTYSGNSDRMNVLIGNNNVFVYNINGDEAFAGTGVLDALNALKDALDLNDMTLVSDQIAPLQALENQVLQAETLAGAKMSSLELTRSNHEKLKLEITNMLADVENANLEKLITAFQMKQIAMQASYNMAAKIGEMTIMDYI